MTKVIGSMGNPEIGQVQRAMAADLAAMVAAAGDSMDNAVVSGMTGGDPSSANAQAAGTGNTTWRANIAAGIVRVDGVELAQTAQADFSLHAGSCLLTEGQAVIARVLEQNNLGTLSTVVVKGTAAAAAAAVAPTDDEVDTALGGLPWVELFRARVVRAGTFLTVTFDHGQRQVQLGAIRGITLETVLGE